MNCIVKHIIVHFVYLFYSLIRFIEIQSMSDGTRTDDVVATQTTIMIRATSADRSVCDMQIGKIEKKNYY